ncbi:hypothetical protein BDV97DRAFT_79493 [Delphinella strobiligena]|nr:hypothetical protein BDV97DRAFT_79493 [Delphinella strobiligena]
MMAEPPLSLSAYAARQQHALGSTAPPVRHPSKFIDPPGLDGNVDEEDDGEIICICAYNWDDGYTIQCETCNKWNHMECYYPKEADRPNETQTHYCVDCQPREVDARRASALQREKYNDQLRDNGPKRPVSKAGRKKAKESPQMAGVVNGWSADKHAHLHGRERKSASPRDQPPPAKRPKTSHRASNAAAGPGRRRNGTINHRSSSKSPGADSNYGPVIAMCSEEFLRLPQLVQSQVNTDTNIYNGIHVTNALSDWLQDPEAVERDCQHKQIDVFKRWDGSFDDMPGKPEVSTQTRVDSKFLGNGDPVTYPCLTVEQEIAQHTFIGEILGHVGFKHEYMAEPEGRWASLRHCEPFVFFHPKLPIFVDARQEGSIYRYVRRSCRPNAEMQTIITEGTTYHFCFMATQDIMPGEEITIGWEFDERIRAIYSQRSQLEESGSGWAPDVRDQIAIWVSNVIANCGPCACPGQGCPMAFFDRRGQPIPVHRELEPAPMKAPKRKRKTAHNLSTDESGRNSVAKSRSGSEARKVEQDEDMTDSRSVSGSYQGDASRDITPNTHYSAVVPELSEREKKKLMREEEMFKKREQEEEKGRQKKKRSSGGSPSANASRQPGHATNSKYADASTSSRNPAASARSSRRGGRQQPSSRPATKSSARATPKPVYVDVAIQCDMDNDEPTTQPLVTPPKKKQYLSVTQRLLRRCASNNFKRKAESSEEEETNAPIPPQGDTMDIDKDESPETDAETADVLPLSPVSDKVKEFNASSKDPPRASTPVPPLSPAFGNNDTDMKDVGEDHERSHTPPNNVEPSIKFSVATPQAKRARLSSNPPMEPPPPPWPSNSPAMSPKAGEAAAQSPNQHTHTITRPDLQVTMPVPPPNLLASTSSSASSQAPGNVVDFASTSATPGPAGNSIFPPAVSASLIPSPITRKKMSLSDYTKRKKAEPGVGHRESSPAISVVSTDFGKEKERDGLLQGSAVTDSPAPESRPSSSAEEKKLDSVQETLDEGEMPSISMVDTVNGVMPPASTVADVIPPAAGTAAPAV